MQRARQSVCVWWRLKTHLFRQSLVMASEFLYFFSLVVTLHIKQWETLSVSGHQWITFKQRHINLNDETNTPKNWVFYLSEIESECHSMASWGFLSGNWYRIYYLHVYVFLCVWACVHILRDYLWLCESFMCYMRRLVPLFSFVLAKCLLIICRLTIYRRHTNDMAKWSKFYMLHITYIPKYDVPLESMGKSWYMWNNLHINDIKIS